MLLRIIWKSRGFHRTFWPWKFFARNYRTALLLAPLSSCRCLLNPELSNIQGFPYVQKYQTDQPSTTTVATKNIPTLWTARALVNSTIYTDLAPSTWTVSPIVDSVPDKKHSWIWCQAKSSGLMRLSLAGGRSGSRGRGFGSAQLGGRGCSGLLSRGRGFFKGSAGTQLLKALMSGFRFETGSRKTLSGRLSDDPRSLYAQLLYLRFAWSCSQAVTSNGTRWWVVALTRHIRQ